MSRREVRVYQFAEVGSRPDGRSRSAYVQMYSQQSYTLTSSVA